MTDNDDELANQIHALLARWDALTVLDALNRAAPDLQSQIDRRWRERQDAAFRRQAEEMGIPEWALKGRVVEP